VKLLKTYGLFDMTSKNAFLHLQLSKVSAPVIIKWLKSEGVKCKCKDKKKELMFKVYQHLGLVQPESSG
jgi:pimeloyl-CoA synthetase